MDGTELRAILAQNIKDSRARRNWSQADLAEKSELSVVYLSDIERGNKWPYLDTLVKIARAFEVEVYELLQPDDASLSANNTAFTRYTAEANAIINKAMETMVKDASKHLMQLRDKYVKEGASKTGNNRQSKTRKKTN